MNKRRQMHLFIILGVSCALVPILLDGLELVDVPAWLRSVMVPLGGGLAGSAVGGLKHQKRLTKDRDYQKRQKAQFDERNQAIRDRAGCIAGFLTVGLLVTSGLIFLSLEWFGIPGWVGWVFIGIYLFYILAFLGLYKWLQRKM